MGFFVVSIVDFEKVKCWLRLEQFSLHTLELAIPYYSTYSPTYSVTLYYYQHNEEL